MIPVVSHPQRRKADQDPMRAHFEERLSRARIAALVAEVNVRDAEAALARYLEAK